MISVVIRQRHHWQDVQQQAVGHDLDQRAFGRLVVETYGMADRWPYRYATGIPDTAAPRSARLRVADQPRTPRPAASTTRELRSFLGSARPRRSRRDAHPTVTDLIDVLRNGRSSGNATLGTLRGDCAATRPRAARARRIAAKRALEQAHVAQHHRVMRKFTHVRGSGNGRRDGASIW